MIEISDLSYWYPQTAFPALDEVSFSANRGDHVLLAGRSGSGKSTLLRTLNGLVPHYHGGRIRGRIRIGGKDPRLASPWALAQEVGTVFQEPSRRFVAGSVADEIAFSLELAGFSGVEIQTRLASIVDRMGLGPLTRRPLHELSGGEQQRVAVAAALGREPWLLLLDEPTSQLDAESADEVLNWTLELCRGKGLTAVIAEHRLERLEGKVDALLFLEAGRPVLSETPVPGLQSGGWSAAALAHMLLSPYGDAIRTPGPDAPPKQEAPINRANGRPRLEARGVRFAYGKVQALKGADIEVAAGQIVGLLGANGSGKTTLLRCLMGLLQPQQGEIRLEGSPIAGRPVPELSRRMAYVPQWPSAMLFSESVLEELRFTLRNHGLEANPPLDPEALLSRFRLSGVAKRYPRDLSAGERQRTALAAVLVVGPSVLLLDEPTLGMDPAAKMELGALLSALRSKGASILLATHDAEFIAAHADRAYILESGRTISAGPAKETLKGHASYAGLFRRPHEAEARSGPG